MKTPKLTSGPRALRGLRKHLNLLRGDVKSNKPLAGFGTSTTETEEGIAVHTDNNSAPGSSGGGGADNLETVTGAVNGVPSTLKVQTDGNGWTPV